MEPLTITILIWQILPVPLLILWLRSRSLVRFKAGLAEKLANEIEILKEQNSKIESQNKEFDRLSKEVKEAHLKTVEV